MDIKTLEFTDFNSNDKSTFPKERGQYLMVYNDKGSNLKYYTMIYFIPEGDPDFEGKSGFYIDKDCGIENEVTKAWGWELTKYAYLPNLWREDGKY